MPGTEEEPSWQEMGPEGVWRGRLLGPVAPPEVFAVLCEERESCRGLGAKVILPSAHIGEGSTGPQPEKKQGTWPGGFCSHTDEEGLGVTTGQRPPEVRFWMDFLG